MKLAVKARDTQQTKVKDLRREGMIPAVIYGKSLKNPLHVAAEKLTLLRTYEKAGMSTPVEITGDAIDQLVLFHHVQVDPVTDRLMHVEFLAVSKTEKVTASVPVELVGVSSFEKNNLGRVQVLLQKIEVTAFPMDLPHSIQVDISSIEHDGQVIHISDLKISDKIILEEDMEAPVATAMAYDTSSEEETEATTEATTEAAA